MSTATLDLQLHSLDSNASDAQVRAVMALSEAVFKAQSSDPNTHTSFAFWRQHLSHPAACITYVTATSPVEPATGVEKPLGFFFSFPRSQPELGLETLHIWLAGVAEEARGLGAFPVLMQHTMQHARTHGYQYLSVATLPDTFKNMYRILEANGWQAVSWKDTDAGAKVVMKLKL